VLRLYRWSPACLSLGRNQPARGLYDRTRARDLGLDIVRRPTGGLAVLHDDEVTYAVIAPAALFGGPRAAYTAINGLLVTALRRLGVPAELATRSVPAPALASGRPTPPCFDSPAAGEVVARGRKLVGSAQRTERRTILQHGSILLAGAQSRVLALAAGAGSPDGGHATLADVLGAAPQRDDVVAAIAAAFRADGGISLASAELSSAEQTRARALTSHFADDAWTWRR
jgi:lipoate-protein ligase A